MKRRKKIKTHVKLHPVMTFIVICFIVVIISGILKLLNFSGIYNALNTLRMDYTSTTESVTSLLNLRGIKYVFSNTVSNFANFTVLSHLIIVLLGIGVMEYSGFLKVAIELLTKRAKKYSITFVIVLICVLASITDNLPFIAFIPLSALIFKYGKRNPNIGIIASFAALTCGYGLSLFFTGIDSALTKMTVPASHIIMPEYSISQFSMILIMLISIIVVSIAITLLTENYIARVIPKYEFSEDELEQIETGELTKPQLRGLILALLGSVAYLLIFIYNIIPGLPFSGNFLNYSEAMYIDKLFGANSFFADGFVFIVTMLFIIWGLLYGIGAKTIKNNREFVDALGYSLNGIGKTLVFIFAGATFISIFKQTNIGNVVVVLLSNLIVNSHFTGLALVILLFLASAVATIFVPSTLNKWVIMSSQVVPTFLNVGISAEFTQVVFRFGECMTLGLTPVFAYYIVYLAYLERYNKNEKSMSIWTSFKYQIPYSLCIGGLLLAIIILWYIISLPLGFGGHINI